WTPSSARLIRAPAADRPSSPPATSPDSLPSPCPTASAPTTCRRASSSPAGPGPRRGCCPSPTPTSKRPTRPRAPRRLSEDRRQRQRLSVAGWSGKGQVENAMIELTEQQRRELEASNGGPVRLLDPQGKQEYVVVRAQVYDRLMELYDDSPWTDEERDVLAWEAGQTAGWDDMDEDDHYPSKP